MSAAVRGAMVPPYYDIKTSDSQMITSLRFKQNDQTDFPMSPMRLNPLSISNNNNNISSMMSPRGPSLLTVSSARSAGRDSDRKRSRQNEEAVKIVIQNAPPTVTSKFETKDNRPRQADLSSAPSSSVGSTIAELAAAAKEQQKQADKKLGERFSSSETSPNSKARKGLLAPFRVCGELNRLGTPLAEANETDSLFSFPVAHSRNRQKRGVTWCTCIDDEGSVDRAVRHSKRTRKVPTRRKKSPGHKRRSHRTIEGPSAVENTTTENKVQMGGLENGPVNYGSQEEDEQWYQKFYEMTLKSAGLQKSS